MVHNAERYNAASVPDFLAVVPAGLLSAADEIAAATELTRDAPPALVAMCTAGQALVAGYRTAGALSDLARAWAVPLAGVVASGEDLAAALRIAGGDYDWLDANLVRVAAPSDVVRSGVVGR
jgi:hypothetical protein